MPQSNEQIVLTYVLRNPGKTATEISKAISVRSSTVSSILFRHSQEGYLMRDPSLYRTKDRDNSRGYQYYHRDTKPASKLKRAKKQAKEAEPQSLWERL